jgi:hypothetical protein
MKNLLKRWLGIAKHDLAYIAHNERLTHLENLLHSLEAHVLNLKNVPAEVEAKVKAVEHAAEQKLIKPRRWLEFRSKMESK